MSIGALILVALIQGKKVKNVLNKVGQTSKCLFSTWGWVVWILWGMMSEIMKERVSFRGACAPTMQFVWMSGAFGGWLSICCGLAVIKTVKGVMGASDQQKRWWNHWTNWHFFSNMVVCCTCRENSRIAIPSRCLPLPGALYHPTSHHLTPCYKQRLEARAITLDTVARLNSHHVDVGRR